MGSYIRDPREEKNFYQESCPYTVYIDFGQDVNCAYGCGDDLKDRIRQFKSRGYVVHLMTGIAWGGYDEFINGKWDGIDHRDCIQRERSGAISREHCHYYYCPTIPYVNYLVERFKKCIDWGVDAIHVEEPEYLSESGYSEAFKREYKLYYHTDWVAPHESVDARYKVSGLQAYLYRRAIDRAASESCAYALEKYGKEIKFYVPTHSLLNYTQWKVLSPEGTLTDIPSLTGIKGQVWSGTSSEPNVYRGLKKDRCFETAFLEYGVLQELVRGTGRDMIFDNDPIEDRPDYTWQTYRDRFIETQVASYLQPHVDKFAVCPWPTRIFGPNSKYPSKDPNATRIPADYASLLMNLFQLEGTFDKDDYKWARETPNVGVFLSDSALYQRIYPDDVIKAWGPRSAAMTKKYPALQTLADGDELKYFSSESFPLFYGLSLPLLKGGLPIRPVQLENVTRYPQYLEDYECLVLSYEFQKPAGADVNNVLADYVRKGGKLVYVGDGTDSFHNVKSWWNTGLMHDATPLEHLLRMLGLDEDCKDGVYTVDKGQFALLRICPAYLTLDEKLLGDYLSLMRRMTGDSLDHNAFSMTRGPLTITAVMKECATDEPTVHEGLFADMLQSDMTVVTKKTVHPGENAVLYDLTTLPADKVSVVGTGIRITSLEQGADGVTLCGRGPSFIRTRIRLKMPKQPKKALVSILPVEGNPGEPDYPRLGSVPVTPDVSVTWDALSGTALFTFDCTAGDLTMKIGY